VGKTVTRPSKSNENNANPSSSRVVHINTGPDYQQLFPEQDPCIAFPYNDAALF
jgi:hypothetical protein